VKFHTIQLLRLIAALLVVCWHAQLMIPQLETIVPYFFGNAGVYLFFAISGFLMVYVTTNGNQSVRHFLTARVIRIVPIYWFYTLGTVILLYVAPSLFRSNELSLSHFLLSLLFIPHKTATDPESFLPMVRVGWTLIYEVFFYGLFAAAMAISLRHRALITTTALLALTVFYLARVPSISGNFLLYVYGDPIVMQFVFGMATAYALRFFAHIKISPMQFVVALIASIAIMHLGDGSTEMSGLLRLAYYGAPSAVIVLLGLLVKNQTTFSHPIINILGDASYSIYLVHMLPLALMRWLWTKFSMPVEGVVWAVIFIAISSTLAAICGILSFILVERPAMRYLKSKLTP
jgi:exopolysaccharide production protein ExoZ